MNNKLTINYQLNAAAYHLVRAQFVEIIFKRRKIAMYHISAERTKNLLCLLCDRGVRASKQADPLRIDASRTSHIRRQPMCQLTQKIFDQSMRT